jgi:hypothetical protein
MAFGVEPQPLACAAVGGLIGAAIGPNLSRLLTFTLYIPVVIASAVLATGAISGGPGRNSVALVIATVFHPAAAAFLEKIKPMVEEIWQLVKTRFSK